MPMNSTRASDWHCLPSNSMGPGSGCFHQSKPSIRWWPEQKREGRRRRLRATSRRELPVWTFNKWEWPLERGVAIVRGGRCRHSGNYADRRRHALRKKHRGHSSCESYNGPSWQSILASAVSSFLYDLSPSERECSSHACKPTHYRPTPK